MFCKCCKERNLELDLEGIKSVIRILKYEVFMEKLFHSMRVYKGASKISDF